MRFAARSIDLAGLDESIARLAALGRATGSSRSRAAMVYAQALRAHTTGRYIDGLGLADEFTELARNEESVLVGEAMLRPLSAIYWCWGDLTAARASAEEGDPPGQGKRSTRARDPPRRTARDRRGDCGGLGCCLTPHIR